MKVLIVSTGGTISHEPDEDGVLISNETSHSGGDFVRILQHKVTKFGLSSISSKTILNKDSGNMSMRDWKKIVDAIVEEYDNYDAFIVTHGTETMGYATAAVTFALENLGKPVCFTGSQACFSAPGSDSIMNLENCLRVITSRRDLIGVFLVFGTQIVSGTRVKKQTEFDYDAFKCSRRFRSLGVLGSNIIYNEPEIKEHLEVIKKPAKTMKDLVVKSQFSPDVIVLSEFPGLRHELIIDLVEKCGIRGIILRSYGSGVPNVGSEDADFYNLRPAFKFLREHKIPLVVTSQAHTGVACMSIYEPSFHAKELGAIPGKDISIEAAVVKLAWLLGQNKSYEEIHSLMQENLRGEIYL